MARPVLHHFSESPDIEEFRPHVPATNPNQAPAVWAIDSSHAPLYWFPRDCPRVTAWPRSEHEHSHFRRVFGTEAMRVHAIEIGWLMRMQSARVYRYDFDPAPFEPWAEAPGQWIAASTVAPVAVTLLTDLIGLHAEANIELRLVPSLWPLNDLVNDDRWDFSIVRMGNAAPRTATVE